MADGELTTSKSIGGHPVQSFVVMLMDNERREIAMNIVDNLRVRIASLKESLRDAMWNCDCEDGLCEWCDDSVSDSMELTDYEQTLKSVLAMFPECRSSDPPMTLRGLMEIHETGLIEGLYDLVSVGQIREAAIREEEEEKLREYQQAEILFLSDPNLRTQAK